jgi:hypothetical protein
MNYLFTHSFAIVGSYGKSKKISNFRGALNSVKENEASLALEHAQVEISTSLLKAFLSRLQMQCSGGFQSGLSRAWRHLTGRELRFPLSLHLVRSTTERLIKIWSLAGPTCLTSFPAY